MALRFSMATVTLDSLDLAALLCSRVCHDVISPVGAIVNGLEVLEDENDPAMHDFALDLIRKSARQASARLQFARLAFGAAPAQPARRWTLATPSRWRTACSRTTKSR